MVFPCVPKERDNCRQTPEMWNLSHTKKYAAMRRRKGGKHHEKQ